MSALSDDFKNVRSFLTRAAYDDEFREFLQNAPPADVAASLREHYGIEITISDKRVIPPKDVCKDILAWTCWAEEYAPVEIGEAALKVFFFVVGHAMPLVVTAEEAAIGAR